MQNLKRAIALTATSLLIVSCSSDDNTQVPQDSLMRISLQAENWTGKDNTATLDWLPIQLNNDHGDAAKLVAQDNAQWSSTGLPTLTYEINFARTGQYLLNVRGRHDSSYPIQPDQNTIITFGSDDGNVELLVNGFDDQWQWTSTDVFGQSLIIEVKTPGIHQFKIASAMTGLMLDQISIDTVQQTVPAEPTVQHDNNNNNNEVQLTDAENQTPFVTINGPATAYTNEAIVLTANATDDGKPDNKIYYYWSKSFGPGDVFFSDHISSSPRVIFNTPGTYHLQVSANDGELYSNANISVTVTEQNIPVPQPEAPITNTNTAPQVAPMASMTVAANVTAAVTGNATDDGLPNNGLYYYWSKLNGPGEVNFADKTTATAQATFDMPGSYKLQLTVSDGELYSNSEVTVTVTGSNNEATIPHENHQPLSGNWKLLNTSGKVTARHEAGGVEVNGKLYVIGGRGNRPVDVYDPGTGKWQTVAKAPMEMHHFQPVAIGNKIYVVGAFTCCYPVEKMIEHVYVFNTQTNRWTKGPKMPANRQRGGAGAAVYNGKIYLLGGNTKGHSGGAVGWFDEFNPNTGKWKTLPTAPDARDHATIAIVNGKLVAAAGRESNYPNTFQNTVRRTNVYNFATGKWSREANIPSARAGTMTVAHHNEVVVIGGESTSGAHANVEAYNVNTGQWRKLNSLKKARHSGAAAFINNVLHVVAGSERRGGGGESSAHEVLNPSS